MTEPAGDTVNRPVIRITSLQQPPEQVFIDTSLPTIAPPPMLFGDTVPSQTSPPLRPTTTATSERLAASILDVSESRDTLTDADRLDISQRQREAPAQQISSVERMAPPNVAAIIPQRASNEVVRHRRVAANKTGDVEKSKPRPQHRKKQAAKTERSKAAVEFKPCPSNAFGDLLKALNMSRGCET